ncbi:MAG: type I glyceraldehyde-3-phosphate dehydrogenase [Candidatus Puniceispirillum sp.]|nr:type I glyceraldehyde-3-phosphate dehydrogenase [Candidatus Pelagibacter sp.]MBA4283445.1 type I glyceraldehyde-3-phosphate dehydrogenase [Candidatus Puniceispirillum sp.]
MTLRVAINGFGRIGRMILRAYAEHKPANIEIVAINDLGPLEHNVHLLTYDSVHGKFHKPIQTTDSTIDIGFGPIAMLSCADPTQLPWKEHNIDIVFECSGRFTKRADAFKHIEAGAKKVLVSAPADGADITVVYGVNHTQINNDHIVLSNASCTTNCLAPLAYCLHKEIGIENGFMTTIHSYTGDQRLVDTIHSDMYRARAAALSMIPSSTGAAKAVGLVLPELKGKLDGTAIRVPTPNVSVVDFKFNTKRQTSVQEINDIVKSYVQKEVSQGGLKNVLGVNELPLVSTDFNHNALSSIYDAKQTHVVEGKLVRILSWYDNEWGFSNRMLDVAQYMSENV